MLQFDLQASPLPSFSISGCLDLIIKFTHISLFSDLSIYSLSFPLISELDRAVTALVRGGITSNSRAAYATAVKRYSAFCRIYALPPPPSLTAQRPSVCGSLHQLWTGGLFDSGVFGRTALLVDRPGSPPPGPLHPSPRPSHQGPGPSPHPGSGPPHTSPSSYFHFLQGPLQQR